MSGTNKANQSSSDSGSYWSESRGAGSAARGADASAGGGAGELGADLRPTAGLWAAGLGDSTFSAEKGYTYVLDVGGANVAAAVGVGERGG